MILIRGGKKVSDHFSFCRAAKSDARDDNFWQGLVTGRDWKLILGTGEVRREDLSDIRMALPEAVSVLPFGFGLAGLAAAGKVLSPGVHAALVPV